MIGSILNSRRISKVVCLGLVLFFCLCLYEVNAGCQSKGKETGLNSPFGVLEFLHWDFQWANYKYADEEDLKKSLALMKEAGVSWVRMDFLWQDIEPKDEEFVFEKYDRIVELAYQNGKTYLAFLIIIPAGTRLPENGIALLKTINSLPITPSM